MQSTFDWVTTVQVTSTGTADVKTVTPAPGNATGALVTAEQNAARVTVDGSVPSPTNGHPFPKDSAPVLLLMSSDSIKFASAAAGTCVLNITWGY